MIYITLFYYVISLHRARTTYSFSDEKDGESKRRHVTVLRALATDRFSAPAPLVNPYSASTTNLLYIFSGYFTNIHKEAYKVIVYSHAHKPDIPTTAFGGDELGLRLLFQLFLFRSFSFFYLCRSLTSKRKLNESRCLSLVPTSLFDDADSRVLF